MRPIFLYFIILLMPFSCREMKTKGEKLQVIQWNEYRRKQDTTYIQIDTLPLNRSFIKIEQLGRINQDIIDTILAKNIVNKEYKLDSLIIWMNPVIKQVFEDKNLNLYNIFISNIKNGAGMNFVYSKDYGVLMQIPNSFTILGVNKLIELNEKMEIIRTVNFTELQTKLMDDTIVFPKVKTPPLPKKRKKSLLR